MSKMFWRVVRVLLLAVTCAAAAQTTKGVNRGDAPLKAKPQHQRDSISSFFHNDRLKIVKLVKKPWPILASGGYCEVKGVLKSESSDPDDALTFPEEDTIICSKSDMTCQVLEVDLGANPPLVEIFYPSESSYQIIRWNAHGLMASISPSPASIPSSRGCNTRVLTMTFQTGEVTLTQVPTRAKGCSMFKDAHSYRLERGWNYVVITTPNGKVKPLFRK